MVVHLVRVSDFLSDPSVTCPALARVDPDSFALLEECRNAASLRERYRLIGVFPKEDDAEEAAGQRISVSRHEFGKIIEIAGLVTRKTRGKKTSKVQVD